MSRNLLSNRFSRFVSILNEERVKKQIAFKPSKAWGEQETRIYDTVFFFSFALHFFTPRKAVKNT